MKNSDLILLILGLVLVSVVIGHAFYIKNTVRDFNGECSPRIDLGEGEFFEDECYYEYNHLYCGIHDVELVSGQSDYVKMEGYENAWWLTDIFVQNDTLFVLKKDPCAPRYVTDESINAVKIFVAADKLKSITVGKNGSIVHPLKPYGSYDDGKPAYKKPDLERHTFRFDSIEINLLDNSVINLLAKGSKLTLNMKNARAYFRNNNYYGGSSLYGTVDELVVNELSGTAYLGFKYFDAKRVHINPLKYKSEVLNGQISVSASDYLHANLYNEMDVIYTGHPTIVKEETGYGRLINTNKND